MVVSTMVIRKQVILYHLSYFMQKGLLVLILNKVLAHNIKTFLNDL